MVSLSNIFIFCLFLYPSDSSGPKKPHIVVLLADDLGWNDVGFHGSNEIPTPNIDALAYNGVILNRHYTQSVCTPSRAAFMTGRYPIRMGMQGGPLRLFDKASLPLNETILPQYLREQGYVTRLIGKWHLGYYKKEFTPTERGFDSFFGFYNGWVRYNDSVTEYRKMMVSGIDARNNFEPAGDRFRGKYHTDVLTEEAIQVIRDHDAHKPLFLEIAYAAVHSSGNDEMQVRNETENDLKFGYISDRNRRKFAGVLNALDDSVGQIIRTLDEKGVLNESIILFMSDNGAETEGGHGLFQNYGSNWPLRGCKNTLFEGAVRGVAAMWSPFTMHNTVATNLMHLTDWLPTLYAAAGGGELRHIDGISQWGYLTKSEIKPPRSEVLININEKHGEAAFIRGDWKFVMGGKRNASTRYSGSSGRKSFYKYNMSEVLLCPTHSAILKYTKKVNVSTFWRCRDEALVDRFCKFRVNQTNENASAHPLNCFSTEGCLFNLTADACEFHDVRESNPKKFAEMKETVKQYEKQLVKQWDNQRIDWRANPKNHNNYWSPWINKGE